MNPILFQVLGILFSALLSFIAATYWFGRQARQRQQEAQAQAYDQLVRRVNDLEKQIGLVGQAVLPISTAFQAILVKELTHTHTPEMDGLLSRLGPPCLLSTEEELRLLELLAERAVDPDPMYGQSEREAARMMPFVIYRARREQLTSDEELLRYQLVMLAKGRDK